MLFKYFIIYFTHFLTAHAVIYHRYFGDKLNDTRIKEFAARNSSRICTINVKPCTPHEGSRVDGTCNNFKHPTRGAAVAPYLRMLKPDYANNQGLRVSTSGEPLPSARRIRTSLQHTGRVVDKNFNMAALHYAGFAVADLIIASDITDYLRERTYCCEPEGRSDPRCIPISVPEDDPYLRVTDIRCLNLTRVPTFQDYDCIPKTLPPEQINMQTPVLDLSTIYGPNDEALALIREGQKGLLKMEKRNNRYVPPGDASDVCFMNMPNESVCYRFGYPTLGNFDLRSATFGIFFMREHNRIAKILAEINPCWKDDRLFKVARQINIATHSNIFFYELLPLFLGFHNMLNNGLISDRLEFLTTYDQNAEQNMYAEFVVGTRYFHTLIEGRVKTYDAHYRESFEYSLSDTLYRTGLLEQNKTFEEMNRGTFYQKAGLIDDIVDPDVSEKLFSKVHRANDLLAMDIQRGRDFGLPGYNAYRPLCGLKRAHKFDDFLDAMDVAKVDALKKLYKEVDDVDLQAGIVSENHIPGGFVGPTLFCIMAKQLQQMRFGDRFWFERGDQFHSLSLAQLQEIRGTSIARLACDSAEGVDRIQHRAFLNVGPGNEHVPCSHIKGIDFTKWMDQSCQKSEDYNTFISF